MLVWPRSHERRENPIMKCNFIAVLDDSEEFGKSFQEQILRLLNNDPALPVYRFTDITSLRNFLYEKTSEWGILFMDILVGKENSIPIAATLKKMSRFWKIVFITGFTDYLSDIFSADPDGLLYKPVDDTHLKDALGNLFEQIEQNDRNLVSFQVVHEGGVRLPANEIQYVESDLRILHIHTSARILDSYGKIDAFSKLLPDDFIRCHRSFLVNANQIKKCSGSELILFDDTKIPISRPYKNNVRNRFINLLKPTIRS